MKGELYGGITFWTERGCTGLGDHSNFLVALGLENNLNLIKYTFLGIKKNAVLGKICGQNLQSGDKKNVKMLHLFV